MLTESYMKIKREREKHFPSLSIVLTESKFICFGRLDRLHIKKKK